MDDAWLHNYTTQNTAVRQTEAKPQKRRGSLLQQPVADRTDLVVESLVEADEDQDPWLAGPPKATLARRAQSYADFYHAVRAQSKKKSVWTRRASTDVTGRQTDRVEKSAELAFEDEVGTLQDRLLEESHAIYQAYYEQLQLSQSHLGGLMTSTTTTLSILNDLSTAFDAVSAQTDAFRQQCESLLTDQRRLTVLADGIEENARYYTYLEPMTRRLNAPSATQLVKGKDFPEMLHDLDNCLVYMESNPSHRESATYRAKYRLLLTRALTLIRHHFTKTLGDIANDIAKRIQAGQLKETTHSALLYAKFRVPAPELKSLGLEVQKRAVPTPDDVDLGREPEYASLMRELYQSYSATRGRLMLPLISKKMIELTSNPQQADILAFAKSSVGFMRGICLDEHELWYEWFETEGALYDFLESLMDPVYDYLRPRTIRETKLEKLCELCATIQSRYLDIDEDEDDANEHESNGGWDRAVSPRAALNGNRYSAKRKLDFANLMQPALQDAQTRLVFLALAVLRDGIENYKPKPADLEWPKQNSLNGTAKTGPVLSGRRDTTVPSTKSAKASTTLDADVSAEAERVFTGDATNSTRQWYPTLLTAVDLLRRIYRLVQTAVFDDLAHRIVHSTTHSLLSAASLVATQPSAPATAKADSQLFLITHLLHLKQQLVAFDIEFVAAPEVDFDFTILSAFAELRERGELWNPTSWYRLVSGAVVGGGLLPKVVENMLDAKAELDGRLRTVINEFVNGYASHILAPMLEIATVTKTGSGGGGKTSANDAEDPLKAVRTTRGLAEKHVPLLRAKLASFIDDARTRETLVQAVRDQVVMGYEQWFDDYSAAAMRGGETGSGNGGRKLSRKGKGREDEVWGPEVFEDVMGGVFGVGEVIAQDEEDEDG